ncbi:hypothetical protein V6O07_19940 [Arthrospira platensis SPKY2]
MMYEYTEVDDEIHLIGEKSKVTVKDKEVFLCCSLNEGRRVLVFSEKEEEPFFTSLEEMTFDFSHTDVAHIFEPKGKSERMDLLLSRVFNYSE